MEQTDVRTLEQVRLQIAWHVQKILLLQQADGMIPSNIEWSGGAVEKKRDLPRQAMATMALCFAQTRVPQLLLQEKITLSQAYIEQGLESESIENKVFILLYLLLADIYSQKDPGNRLSELSTQTGNAIFVHPIATNLYLRIASLLPTPLLHVDYVAEAERYAASLTPQPGRFFDHADILVWAKQSDPALALLAYDRLLLRMRPDGWFCDLAGNTATASVVGKLFEVFEYYLGVDHALPQKIYTRLMQHKAQGEYARQSLGMYLDHSMSEPNILRIDDVHSHLLVGLCYRYQQLLNAYAA